MFKIYIVLMLFIFTSMLKADKITDVTATDVNPLQIGDIMQTDRVTATIKPFTINQEKCEVEFNNDLDHVKNIFSEQIKRIWGNLKNDASYLVNEMEYMIVQETIIKTLAGVEFMIQNNTTELISGIQGELQACIAKVEAKTVSSDVGGGAGDQGFTMKFGFNPKEQLAIMECYKEVVYPTNPTNDDIILLKQYEDKYRKLISQIMYGQLNIMIENMVQAKTDNVCNNLTKKKQENFAYLVDMLENGKIVLLNNKNIKSSIYFELLEEENQLLSGKYTKDAGEITEVRVNEDEIAKQELFVDMEPDSFEVFKEDVKGYMVSLVNNYGITLNSETVNILQEMIIDEIFEVNELSKNLQTLLISLSRSPEYYYNRYNKGVFGEDFTMARVDIVREVLNKTLVYTYSKGEYIRQEKLKIYYANVQQFIQVNNAFLLQILILDRYMFRYKEKINNAIIKNIAKKKEIEKEIYFRDFCAKNKLSIYEELCEAK